MHHNYFQKFSYCPQCGTKYKPGAFNASFCFFFCDKCGFCFYQNSKPSVAAIIVKKADPCQILLTIRAIEPRKKMLHLPGGFLNYGEHPESGIRRELMEELGIKAEKLTLFNSEVVDYSYRQDLHSVVTLFYLTQPIETAPLVTEAEIASCAFHTLHELPKQKKRFAFASDLLCLEKYSQYLEEKSVF